MALRTFRRGLSGFGFAPIIATASIAVAQTLTPIAFTGMPAPGAGTNVTFRTFDPSNATLAPDGNVGFKSTLAGPGIAGDEGISFWSGAPSSLGMLARTTLPTPDIGNATFVSMGGHGRVANGGQMAFIASAAGPGIGINNSGGVWGGTAGNVHLVARHGSPAPGVPTGVFDLILNLPTNQHGQIGFFANLRGTGVAEDHGIWTGMPGAIQLLARKGQPAPGTNFAFKDFGDQLPPWELNSSGVAAIFANTTQVRPDSSNDRGIWMGTPGNLQRVFTAGIPAPDLPSPLIIRDAPDFILNDANQLCFLAFLDGPGIGSNNHRALYTGGGLSGTPLKLVLRTGDQVPGAAEGRLFKSVGRHTMNNLGQVAVSAETTGEPLFGSVLMEGGPGDLQLVTSSHAPAPGTDSTFKSFGIVHYNDSGMLVFNADLDNGKAGIWVSDESHTISPVLLAGQTIDVGGVSKTVSFPVLPFDAALTETGQLLLGAVFTDGSQALLLTTVPEPSASAILITACIGLRVRRRAAQQTKSGPRFGHREPVRC